MSKKWTPELDFILLHGVFEECRISFSRVLCERLAGRIRAAGAEGFTECTPKAVKNRLHSWKKKNMSAAGTTTSTPATPKKVAAEKDTATPKTKTPRARKGAAKMVEAEIEEDQDEDQLKSPSVGRKRKSESEEAGDEKKIKIEALDPQEYDEVMGGGEGEV